MKLNKHLLVFITLLIPAFAFASGGTFVETGHKNIEQHIADVLVWIVIILVPIALVIVYWKIHILPEQYAEKVHHPQTKLIQIICILSIIFGGLLWPIAWILAYSKPVLHKMAYGTDKSDEFFLDPDGEHADKPLNLSIVDDEIANLAEKLENLTKRRENILAEHPVKPTK
jgi:vacuolar-type H+-ATPase subunit I/STV1